MAKNDLEAIREDLGLTRMDAASVDPAQILFFLIKDINQAAIKDLTDLQNFNAFNSGIRALESTLYSKMNEDDRLYLMSVRDKLRLLTAIEDKVSTLYDKYDFLNNVRDNRVAELNYVTYEGETRGALSKYVAGLITEEDSNIILGIFGKPRTGKSLLAGRIGLNVSAITGSALNLADVVYSNEGFLAAKEERRKQGTLKGSVQIVDEGGNTADAMAWWDDEVQEVVRHIRTQGRDNTCTIIVSPMFTDIASKARGLLHGTLIPWKEWGRRYMELTDTRNIDRTHNISAWKLDFLDTDPMTGKTYPGKLKAALGNIIKVDALKPSNEWVLPYVQKADRYKLKLQRDMLNTSRAKKLRGGDDDILDKYAEEVVKNLDQFKGQRSDNKVDLIEVSNHFKVGERLARKIKRKALKLLGEDTDDDTNGDSGEDNTDGGANTRD